MMNTKFLNVIVHLKKKNPNLIIQIFGDSNQCPPIEDNNEYIKNIGRYFEFINKRCFRELVKNIDGKHDWIDQQYFEFAARYDKPLRECLQHLMTPQKNGMHNFKYTRNN
jgi:hypothetical protein